MSEAAIATHQDIVDELVQYIDKQNLSLDEAKLLTAFARQYFARVTLEDLLMYEISHLYGMVLSHWQLLYQREMKECKVRVFNPHYDTDGWQSNRTVVEIIQDDMPFLVDSSQMEINRLGLNIHFMIYWGQLCLRRDEQHRVIEVLPPGAGVEGIVREAPIYIEIDKQTDPALLDALQNNLQRVLSDVRLVVEDWASMRARMHQALEELEQAPPQLDQAELSESKDFLRWLEDDHFIFIGCRDYDLIGTGSDMALHLVPGSGLGVLRKESISKAVRPLSTLPVEAQHIAISPEILVISKTNTKSTIHRPAYTDYIGVKRFNAKGELIGEHRFIGLYTSIAYNSNPKQIPFLRHKVDKVMQRSQLIPQGHAGKALLNILETLPRDDLFQSNVDELFDICMGVLNLQERQKIRLFVRKDIYGRFFSCLVYVPRERVDTELRQKMQNILMAAFNGTECFFSILYSESILTRIHYLIRVDTQKPLSYDLKKIESQLIQAGHSWNDILHECLSERFGEEEGNILFNRYGSAFPSSYRADFTPDHAIDDIYKIVNLAHGQALEMDFYQRRQDVQQNILHFKLFQPKDPFPLSDVLPLLENMGLRVLEERPYEITLCDKSTIWISDYYIILAQGDNIDVAAAKELFQQAFRNVWDGYAQNDGFNRLILSASVTWREISILRAYSKYLRQIAFRFSQTYIEKTVAKNPGIAKQLIETFKLRFDPQKNADSADAIAVLDQQILAALDSVTNLDEDRILRRFFDVIKATLRTNYFQQDVEGNPKAYLSFKFDPAAIPELPFPHPKYEIFVCSPRVEGVHLRGSKVARGGIRWSDRREDFRTEVLGLMKAQQVKNAVIVPSGAKGGFVVKNLPTEREAILDEVVFCYQTFIRGMLDITDNLIENQIVPPVDTVRYDDDDPYLVVAADKGTATFSDIANEISSDYHFWLGDAFASGGSAGYDHKKMAITARGAWESVKRHFRSLNMNIQETPFTVVGIGDMSGDVFGNGMLLSRKIRLVGAFNHMHIFLDPNPDPETSFIERKRLFHLPRSTWEDYNPELISKGGGVFNRSAKSIVLSPEIKALLDVNVDRMEPNVLIRALLKAPVDLLWNGGIGTYVKASYETHAEVGDRANEALRVNGDELKCTVVGEGGNLGFTQLGRVEYALAGGLIYTDFIDNSAGVDCSDHEVNIKILLNDMVIHDQMTVQDRNQLLAEMTDDVAALVLQDNYYQTQTLSVASVHAHRDIDLYQRYMESLEQEGKLDRALEFLPDNKTLHERKAQGEGLVLPEMAIMLAYSKMDIKQMLLKTDIPEDPYFANWMTAEFPSLLQQRFSESMKHHRLRREIIATQITNSLISDMGIPFFYRMYEELGATIDVVIRAYAVAVKLFSMHELLAQIEALDYQLSTVVQVNMMYRLSRLIRRATRWLLHHHRSMTDIAEMIDYFSDGVELLYQRVPALLTGEVAEKCDASLKEFIHAGVPEKLASRIAIANIMFASLDIIEIAKEENLSYEEVGKVYFDLGERLELGWLREHITNHPMQDHWDERARVCLRDDLNDCQRDLTHGILRSCEPAVPLNLCLDNWLQQHQREIAFWHKNLMDLRTAPTTEFIMFSVTMRQLDELAKLA